MVERIESFQIEFQFEALRDREYPEDGRIQIPEILVVQEVTRRVAYGRPGASDLTWSLLVRSTDVLSAPVIDVI
jgi:hypothetical protein